MMLLQTGSALVVLVEFPLAHLLIEFFFVKNGHHVTAHCVLNQSTVTRHDQVVIFKSAPLIHVICSYRHIHCLSQYVTPGSVCWWERALDHIPLWFYSDIQKVSRTWLCTSSHSQGRQLETSNWVLNPTDRNSSSSAEGTHQPNFLADHSKQWAPGVVSLYLGQVATSPTGRPSWTSVQDDARPVRQKHHLLF